MTTTDHRSSSEQPRSSGPPDRGEVPARAEALTRAEVLDRAWRDHYPHLVNVAFRLLGDIAGAEDAAQEAFTRLAAQPPSGIDDVRGWLTVVTGRVCLDRLRSAYTRRERSPAPERMSATVTQPGTVDPANLVVLETEVVTALHVVLQCLGPAERVAFVLHDVFGMPFADVAAILGRPAATCRQLAHRGRRKIDRQAPPVRDDAAHRRVVDAFLTACHNGDLDELAANLAPDAWGRADFPAGTRFARWTARGRERVSRNLLRYLPRGVILVDHPTAPVPTLLAFQRRRLFAVIALTVDDDVITALRVTVDSDRIATGPTRHDSSPAPRMLSR